MFGSQALRLLRESWKNATSLAEELYAIFSSEDIPLSSRGGLTLYNNGQDAPLQLKGFSDGDNVIKITRKDGDEKNITFRDGDLIWPGTADKAKNADNKPQKQETQVTVFRGEVVSGSGSSYRVRLDGKGAPVAATQLQIAADETIPAGTKTVVWKSGDAYYMQVPVWLEDPAP